MIDRTIPDDAMGLYPVNGNNIKATRGMNLIKTIEDFERLISISSVHNFRCPYCSMARTESMIQEKVRTYIENMKYTIYEMIQIMENIRVC